MSSTIVYGCDWCGEIVEKDRDEKPKYAAKVTIRETENTAEEDICKGCRSALQALRQGRYKR